MLYRLYIGSNNKTKRLEELKAVKIVSQQFQGFTAYKGLGYWQGKKEKCLILEIESRSRKDIIGLAKKLAKGLQQEAVGLSMVGKMSFIAV